MLLSGYLIVTGIIYAITALANITQIVRKEDPGINLFALFVNLIFIIISIYLFINQK